MFQFDSFADFMTMDGHGVYVWVSYLITLVVMVWLLVWPLVASRHTRKAVRRGAARQERFAKPRGSAEEPDG
ncbi:MAG: heme exporter protein CcmD [Porticoccaceae bacterium]